jgi:hypothetical protein
MRASFLTLVFIFTLVPASWAIEDDALVFYLPFEEGSGDITVDQSGNNIEGELNGAKWSNEGRFGGCIHLDADTSYVEFPAAPELDITDQITIEFWILPEQSQGDSNILGRRSAANVGGYCVQWSAQFTGEPMIETWLNIGGWQGTRQQQTVSPELGNWHHIASVYDGSSMKQYVDGAIDIEVPIPGKIASIQEVFRIGKAQTGLAGMIGRVDEVVVYKRALSEKEINEDMTKGIMFPVSPAGNLVTVWGNIKGE